MLATKAALASGGITHCCLRCGLAELALYSRLNTASNPSSTSWRLVRSIVAMLVSSAAAIRLSLQPSPASYTSAFKENARLPQQLRGTLTFADQFIEFGTFLRGQPHYVLLDGDLFPGHESPPSLACGDRDSEIAVIFNDGGDKAAVLKSSPSNTMSRQTARPNARNCLELRLPLSRLFSSAMSTRKSLGWDIDK
jgi:hypothetical protein